MRERQPQGRPGEGAAATQPAVRGNFEDYRNARTGDGVEMLYAAGGTFSLPVTLPEGQVQLDFARPGGDAEVSVLVVSEELVGRAYGTAEVVGTLIGLLILWRILRAIGRAIARRVRRPHSAVTA
jgi:hypothetical protein